MLNGQRSIKPYENNTIYQLLEKLFTYHASKTKWCQLYQKKNYAMTFKSVIRTYKHARIVSRSL